MTPDDMRNLAAKIFSGSTVQERLSDQLERSNARQWDMIAEVAERADKIIERLDRILARLEEKGETHG